MCLLTVYLEKGNERRRIAEEVALIVREKEGFKLLGLDLEGEEVVETVEVSLVDTLNSILVFTPKK